MLQGSYACGCVHDVVVNYIKHVREELDTLVMFLYFNVFWVYLIFIFNGFKMMISPLLSFSNMK